MSYRIAQSLICFYFLLVTPANAELLVIEDAEGQQGFTVFRMTVSPASEPVPALKHRLTLRPHELNPGNAAIHYVRVHAENILASDWRGVREKFGEVVYDWCDIEDVSLTELPLDDVREASSILDTLVEHFIEPGTRCRDSDWGLELEDLRGLDSFSYLLPDFQSMRTLARILALRTRLRIAEHHYDDALDHLRMNYRLAHDVGQEKLLVCNLIGMAIEGMANKTSLDLMAAPNSPNLYWALAELPEPLIDTYEAIRLEMTLGLRIFPVLLEVETAEFSQEKWSRLMVEGLSVFQQLGELEKFPTLSTGSTDARNMKNRLASTALSMAAYPAAKERLRRGGVTPDRLEKMPVGQVLLIDVAREYQEVADSLEKWWYLPYPLARERMNSSYRASNATEGDLNYGKKLASVLLPAIQAVKTAQLRMQWQKNALMTIEALRMHAAETGRFPASLDDVQVVPVPRNPITQQPYVYQLDGEMAVLELPFSDGMPGVAWRFEMRMAAEK